MRLPRWVEGLLRRFVVSDTLETLLGDLEEVHRARVERRGVPVATLLTGLEALETVCVIRWAGRRRRGDRTPSASRRTPLFSWLDLKLGLRMLVKYPGLTLVGGLAMAFAIWVCVGGFEFYTQVVNPKLPLDDGDRIVGITVVDAVSTEQEPRILRDFGIWRRELASLVELGAYQPLESNLALGQERGAPIEAAAITASGFAVPRVSPILGRALVPSDEEPDAPFVVVLGYDVWTSRLGGDRAVVGRTVRVGDEEATVVGVMPPGFAFPVNQSLWVPLRTDPTGVAPREGPGVRVFGRLATGASLEQAQAELTALGTRAASEHPESYGHLRPIVLPYAKSVLGVPRAMALGLTSINLGLIMLLAIVCSNVALLVFARAAGREAELLVRTALGASRRRVVGQLFAEALVLGLVAAAIGVSAAGMGLQWLWTAVVQGELLEGTPLPFWIRPGLSPASLFYAAALTVVAAAIAGVVPALKVTGKAAHGRLKQATAGGGRLHFGGIWTAVIVFQIALTLALPFVAWTVRRDAAQIRSLDIGFDSEEFLTAQLRVPRDDVSPSDYAERFGQTAVALAEGLEADASIAGVTYAASRPGTYHAWRRVELDEGGAAPPTQLDEQGPGRWVWGGRVAPNFFEVLAIEVLQGRSFRDEDAVPESRVVVVNQSFVDRVLGGRNPLGRHLRYLGSDDEWDGVALGDPPGPWYRIVGVVPDLGMHSGGSSAGGAGLYHAVPPNDLRARWLLARTNGTSRGHANQLRAVAADVDPTLALEGLQALDHVRESELRFYAFWFWLSFGVSSITLLLSLAGIYAVMSFTVARRTHEIGVRVALGARPSRVARAIFRRPLIQVGYGTLAGWGLTALLCFAMFGADFWGVPLVMTLGYGVLMTGVCLSACVVPTRRALAVQPTQALRTE